MAVDATYVEEAGAVERVFRGAPAPEELDAEEMEFFETVCRNRGLDVRVFRDRDAALGWLTA